MANQDVATKADIERVILLMQQLVHQLEDKMDWRFDAVDRRFKVMESRMDRMGGNMIYLRGEVTTFRRWAEGTDRVNSSILGTRAAQQKAINNLNERITRLEQNNAQRNQN